MLYITHKALIGIAPSGTVTFISQLRDCSVSDKEIVNRSWFLSKELWEINDSWVYHQG